MGSCPDPRNTAELTVCPRNRIREISSAQCLVVGIGFGVPVIGDASDGLRRELCRDPPGLLLPCSLPLAAPHGQLLIVPVGTPRGFSKPLLRPTCVNVWLQVRVWSSVTRPDERLCTWRQNSASPSKLLRFLNWAQRRVPGTVHGGMSMLSPTVRSERLGGEFIVPRTSATMEDGVLDYRFSFLRPDLVAVESEAGETRILLAFGEVLDDPSGDFIPSEGGFPMWYRLWAVCGDNIVRVFDRMRNQLREVLPLSLFRQPGFPQDRNRGRFSDRADPHS